MSVIKKTKNAVTKINEIKVQSIQEKMMLKLLTVITVIILLGAIANTVDTIYVKKYHKGPFFAFPLKVYQDGPEGENGTKEYYGFFYKVIKYNQQRGRRDMVIGSWFMKYSSSPVKVTPIDLAFEFRNNPTAAYKKYKNHLLKIEGKLEAVDLDANKARLKYTDTSKKESYTLEIVCNMAKGEDVINNIVGTDVVVIGMIDTFSVQTKTKPNKLVIKDAFIG